MITARIIFKRDQSGYIKPSITRPFSMYADIKNFISANKDTVLKVVDRQGVRI